MNFPNLYGDRIDLIDLNEIGEKGLKDMFVYSKEPAFYKHMEHEQHKTMEETRECLHKFSKRSRTDTGHYWFISLKEENKIIGTFGLLNIDERKGSASISYGISPHYWSKGYFSEALEMVLRCLFLEHSFYRVYVVTQTTNQPSINALRRAGFKKEGVMRGYYLSFKDEKRYDAAIFGLLRGEIHNRLKGS